MILRLNDYLLNGKALFAIYSLRPKLLGTQNVDEEFVRNL
jgi:hypothetical protein